MRFRVALVAVLAFALVDLAQGFGPLGAGAPSTLRRSMSRGEVVATVPAADPAPVPGPPPPPVTEIRPGARLPNAPAPPTTSGAVAPGTTTATPQPPPDAVVARVVAAELRVYETPTDAKPSRVLSAITEFGNPRVLLATQARGGWVQVRLPIRPNGALGWVRSDTVTLSSTPDVLDVDVDAHRLTWGRRGEVMLSVAVATGAAASPTPRGTFFVTDVLPQDPSGALGAWVLALDGHSDAFSEFEGGDARLAIHGTDDPASIGHAASFGCIRVDDAALARLAAAIGPGTPVVIH